MRIAAFEAATWEKDEARPAQAGGPQENLDAKPEYVAEPPASMTTGKGKPKRTFRIARPDHLPEGALRWSTGPEKLELRRRWGTAVRKAFAGQARVIATSWAIASLSEKYGYAFAGDTELSSTSGLRPEKLQGALTRLERGGAIIRVHVPGKEDLERRIYLSEEIIRATSDTRQNGGSPLPAKTAGSDTRQNGGREDRQRHTRKRQRNLTTAEQAQLAAEMRDARARGEPVPRFFEDAD